MKFLLNEYLIHLYKEVNQRTCKIKTWKQVNTVSNKCTDQNWKECIQNKSIWIHSIAVLNPNLFEKNP